MQKATAIDWMTTTNPTVRTINGHLETKDKPQTVCLKLHSVISSSYFIYILHFLYKVLEEWHLGIFMSCIKTFTIHGLLRLNRL